MVFIETFYFQFGKRRKKREEGGLPNDLHQLMLEGKRRHVEIISYSIVAVVGIEEFDEEFREDNIESDPWYVDAVKRLIEVKEEAEDDLICDVGYDSKNLNQNLTSTIYEGNYKVLK